MTAGRQTQGRRGGTNPKTSPSIVAVRKSETLDGDGTEERAEQMSLKYRISNIEYRTAEVIAGEVTASKFNIRYSIFDILQFAFSEMLHASGPALLGNRAKNHPGKVSRSKTSEPGRRRAGEEERRSLKYRISNIEYRISNRRSDSRRSRHFNIHNSIFDILRFAFSEMLHASGPALLGGRAKNHAGKTSAPKPQN